jgi:hypothetical protein
MHIQSYFKNGKAKKYINKVKSIKVLFDLFEDMNEGKCFSTVKADNFSKRDFVYSDGSRVNLWGLMKQNGFFVIS